MSAKGGKGGKGGRGKSDGKKSVTKSAKVCYNDSYFALEIVTIQNFFVEKNSNL